MSKRKKLKPKFRLLFYLILLIIIFFVFKNIPKKNNNIDNTTTTTTIVNKESKKVNITLFGDMLIEGPFYRSINKYNEGELYFNKVNNKYFKNDDITIGNMEVPISSEDKFLG